MMHLAHPALTTTGKRKTRQRWASAEAKRQAQELEQNWQNLQKSWQKLGGKAGTTTKSANTGVNAKIIPDTSRIVRDVQRPPDLQRGALASTAKNKYTGTSMIGIAQMPKSNAVPVFNNQAIIEIGKMRRG